MTLPGPFGTLLEITPLSGIGKLTLSPYSARNLTQTLRQIGDKSLIRRTVNGVLVDLQPEWLKQYQSTITCTDVNTPCLDDAWRGELVEVSCAAELNYPTGGTPARPVVHGSERSETHPGTGFTTVFYRPILIMRVMDIDRTSREWAAEEQWRVELEETPVA